MFRRLWLVRALAVSLPLVVAAAMPAHAENNGQDDLDKATQLKVAAETLDDLAQVIDRLDSALEKGLDQDNEELARQMLVSTLMQRGSMFSAAALNVPPQDPQRLMRLMQLRSWALTDLQRVLEIDSEMWDAQLQIGRLQAMELGDTSAAKRAFTKIVKAENATSELKAEAYSLRSQLQSDDALRVEDIGKAIELAPKKPDYLRLRGAYFYRKEKHDEALADIDAALKLDDKHAETHELRGMILLGAEKYDEALASFNRASELEPKAALPYQHRAELYRQKGDLEKAVEQLTKALELSPDNAATLLIRSAVYFELKQTDKALEDVEQAIRVEPRFAQPYMMRAEIYAATDRLDEGIKQLEELVKKAPGNVPILSRLGSFYLMASRPRKAIEVLTLVLQEDPDNYSALRYRGDAYLNIGKHAEAIADFDKALALQDDDESLLNNFAWVLATSPDDKLRNGKRAIELATKASEKSGHQIPHVLSTLGAAYAESGDFETAKKWSKQAVELSKKAFDEAKTDEERAKLKQDTEQLEKELASYEEGKPVRERQTAEEGKEKEDDKPEEADKKQSDEDEKEKQDRLTPAGKPEASGTTAEF